jgi:hypothetical protein
MKYLIDISVPQNSNSRAWDKDPARVWASIDLMLKYLFFWACDEAQARDCAEQW